MAKKAKVKVVKIKAEKVKKVKEKPQAIAYHDGSRDPKVVSVSASFSTKLEAEKYLFSKGWRGGHDGVSWWNNEKRSIMESKLAGAWIVPFEKVKTTKR